ncbi:MAG TPA: hydroxyacid dehydrogenase [Blastocatellia bacterium]|nr:hydroxyacid dehydrogenase [Blastocatellia bacterium]
MNMRAGRYTGTGENPPTTGGERPRVLVLASEALFPFFFPEENIARLDEVAQWERYAGRTDSPQLREMIARSDALITTWHSPFLRAEMIDAASRLGLIAHCGGEVRARVEEALFDRIIVTNAPQPMAMPAAEMAMAMALALVRKLPAYQHGMRSGGNVNNNLATAGERLSGRRVGVVGFGRIGQTFARLIEPFGVELFVSDPTASAAEAARCKATIVSLDELLRACSVVVLAAALTAETRGMLDARRLSLLPDGAYLINVARGGLIDMEALLAQLRAGRITAALDVTDPLEPLPEEHELRRLPNVLLTPHVAAGGVEVRREMGAIAVEEVTRFLRGERPENIVTREMLKRMT